MVLRMTRPVRHPKTGIFQFRKRVPEQLIPIIGKREEKVSLKTRDPVEAKIAHARISAEVEARWRQFSVGLLSLSQKQAVAMAGQIYQDMVSSNEDNPGDSKRWAAAMLSDYVHLHPEKVRISPVSQDTDKIARVLSNLKTHRNDRQIRAYLDRFGYRLDEASMKLVCGAVATAVLQAKEHIARLAEGDYTPDPKAGRFPELDLTPKTETKKDLGIYALTQVFEDYAKEKKVAPKTYEKWKPIIAKVAAEVPDARDLTSKWVIEWKDKLVAAGHAQSHVQNSYLGALKATCKWGRMNERLAVDPAAGVSVAIPDELLTRKKEFTAKEAKTILTAALVPDPSRSSVETKAARRWVPWLCAYTGARVGEITQLRKQDIEQHDEHWLIWITPEAGSTKTKRPRHVAVHPHLVELGFLEFVQAQKDGPLFYDPGRSRGGKRSNSQHNKVGEKLAAWVREIGVDDERIKPNHAWRHLFKTKARGVFMDVGARDYMQGHAPASQGEAYGGFEPHVLAHEMAKFPRFSIDK